MEKERGVGGVAFPRQGKSSELLRREGNVCDNGIMNGFLELLSWVKWTCIGVMKNGVLSSWLGRYCFEISVDLKFTYREERNLFLLSN